VHYSTVQYRTEENGTEQKNNTIQNRTEQNGTEEQYNTEQSRTEQKRRTIQYNSIQSRTEQQRREQMKRLFVHLHDSASLSNPLISVSLHGFLPPS
jgi:hypothetical protein